ncbi:GlxA family transcriptional regulator [Sandarakinorhabdus sp.]|uniref:GlxA family transcriptional regulator n=1 Tax=Sandarakinorhabdus sp. TaxID=1916663 RepID=UPI00286DA313|nr:GlxA family transcriptional regulator [Sandarakinorhabdus sp.]
MTEAPLRIGLVGFDGVQTLDLTGPLDAFGAANQARPGAYAVTILGIDGAPFTSEAGMRIMPDGALAAADRLDTLIIAGGEGLRRGDTADRVASVVSACAPNVRRIVSVCTGIYGLAPTGLLDGRRVTTHWGHARAVAAKFPALCLEPDAIFIKDERFYTSAGITAAIDLSLALIEEDFGPGLAISVARDLVVYFKRAGGQRQYSEPLRLQSRAGDRFADLAGWIVANLHADLSVAALASRVALSPRQFSRAFQDSFAMTPAAYVEMLRLDAARQQLTSTGATMKQIAAANGFASDDSFRRAFERQFGLPPSDYRAHFTAGRRFSERTSP